MSSYLVSVFSFCFIYNGNEIKLIDIFTGKFVNLSVCSIIFSPDGFASDPFKGSDPFGADNLFPEVNVGADDEVANVNEADTSLSCAENKASTGTQCFESEFPDEDSDIEISYSREDLDAIAENDDSCGFKPIQSSSEELGPHCTQPWKSQGQCSVESDPDGYELDLETVSPLTSEVTAEAQATPEQGNLP